MAPVRRLAAAVVLAALWGASEAAAQLAPIGPSSGNTATIRAKARAAKPDRPFRLGIVGGTRPEAALERVEPFRAHLADRIGDDVTVTPFADERRLAAALAAGKIDYAPLSALGYATATQLCGCVEPLAAARAADRASGWHVMVLTRAKGGLARPEALAGATLAISGEDAIGTRRLALRMLADAGLAGRTAPRLVGVAGPAEALAALAAGQVDAAVTWGSLEGDPAEGWTRGTLHDAIAAGTVAPGAVRPLWTSPVLPYGPHTVRAELGEGRKRRLREMLIQLDEDPDVYEAIEKVRSGGFVRVGAPAYAPFVDLLKPTAPPNEPAGAAEPTRRPGSKT